MTFSINAIGSDTVNLLAISSVASALLTIQNRPYEKQCNNILESCFILNLCIFSIATFYVTDRDSESQLILSNLSISITFILFVGISLFHIYLRVKSCTLCEYHVMPKLCKFWLALAKRNEHLDRTSTETELLNYLVTSTTVDIREPLI